MTSLNSGNVMYYVLHPMKGHDVTKKIKKYTRLDEVIVRNCVCVYKKIKYLYDVIL